MSKDYDDAISRRYLYTWGNTNTYKDYPDMDSDDEDIERFVEELRQEYYDAWFAYIAEFE